jgi:hypothetical protein
MPSLTCGKKVKKRPRNWKHNMLNISGKMGSVIKMFYVFYIIINILRHKEILLSMKYYNNVCIYWLEIKSNYIKSHIRDIVT